MCRRFWPIVGAFIRPLHRPYADLEFQQRVPVAGQSPFTQDPGDSQDAAKPPLRRANSLPVAAVTPGAIVVSTENSAFIISTRWREGFVLWTVPTYGGGKRVRRA